MQNKITLLLLAGILGIPVTASAAMTYIPRSAPAPVASQTNTQSEADVNAALMEARRRQSAAPAQPAYAPAPVIAQNTAPVPAYVTPVAAPAPAPVVPSPATPAQGITERPLPPSPAAALAVTPPPQTAPAPVAREQKPATARPRADKHKPRAEKPKASLPVVPVDKHEILAADQFVLKKGSLKKQIDSYCKENGYSLSWRANVDYQITNETTVSGGFENVIKNIFESLNANGNYIHAVVYRGNHTVLIDNPKR